MPLTSYRDNKRFPRWREVRCRRRGTASKHHEGEEVKSFHCWGCDDSAIAITSRRQLFARISPEIRQLLDCQASARTSLSSGFGFGIARPPLPVRDGPQPGQAGFRAPLGEYRIPAAKFFHERWVDLDVHMVYARSYLAHCILPVSRVVPRL